MTLQSAMAQQPGKVTRKWFPDPDIKIESPAFTTGKYYTTYKGMKKYLQKQLAAYPQLMDITSIGKTQKGREIPMVTISDKASSQTKLRVLFTGAMHGDEHAGTEGLMWFIHQLGADASTRELLTKIDFYIIPMLNVDGSEADTRYTHNGTDPNRDHTRLSTPEITCLHKVATDVKPHLYVDYHEFKPLRTSYEEISDRIISNPNDFMFLYSSNPNVYPELTELIEQEFIPNTRKMAESWNLRNSIYYTTRGGSDGTIMNVGGHSSRSSSNIMALRGCVSMLMEIRGIGLGKTSYLRRVNTIYQLCQSYSQTAFNNSSRIIGSVEKAERQNRPVAIAYSIKTEKNQPFLFLDLLKNEIITYQVDAKPAKELKVTKKVSRPKAYVIDGRQTLAIDLIKKFGIRYEEFRQPRQLDVEAYRVKSSVTQKTELLNIHPVAVKVQSETLHATLPEGSILIPMSQPLSTLAAILLEPECVNGFVYMQVIDAQLNECLPVYRINE